MPRAASISPARGGRGYVYALVGALLFGSNGSVVRLLVEAGLTPLQVTQFRTVGTAVLAGLLLLLLDRSGFILRPRQLLVMAVLGVGGVALLQASYAAAVTLLPVGIALLLEYLAVPIVALVAFLAFRERVRARLWVAIACVLVGLAVVAQVWDSRLDGAGVLFGLAAAATLAFYFLVGERQVAATSPLVTAFWTTLFASLFWAGLSGWWTLRAETFTTPVDLGGAHGELLLPLWLPLVFTMVVGSFLPFLLSFLALKHLTATAAGIVASAEVLFAFAVAWLWLGQALDPLQVAGAAVVLVGIVLAQTARAGKVVDAELVIPAPPDVGGRP